MLKNTVTRILKMIFHGLINRLDKAEERVFRLENMTTEISKNEKQRERLEKKRTEYLRTVDNYKRYNIYAGDNQKEKKERRTEHRQYLKQ